MCACAVSTLWRPGRPVFRSYRPADGRLRESVLPDVEPRDVETLLGDAAPAEISDPKPDQLVCAVQRLLSRRACCAQGDVDPIC